jgi:probable F420-dependent oxidoreductase
MRFGVFIFPSDTAIRPDDLATEVEKRGFDSLWFPEHSHIPASRKSPWGGQTDAPDLPEHYWRSNDAFISLAYAAAATEHLKLGTGITLVAQRDPIWTAKEVASLDFLSRGRVLFGVGYGWNREEMAHHGADFKDRRTLLREKVLMMKELWTADEASFEGKHVSLSPSWAWPKPVQKPHPPIVMGASANKATVADMVEFCDGWMPLVTRMDVVSQVKVVRKAVEKAGRDPDAFEITAYAAKTDQIDELEKAGVDAAIFTLPSLGADVTLPRLDMLASAVGIS